MKGRAIFAIAAALCCPLACGGSDKTVRTQNRQVVDDDGDVKQQTTVTTTDDKGEVEKVEKKDTEIHDD